MLQRTPASAGSTEKRACWPIAGSTSTNWRNTRPSKRRTYLLWNGRLPSELELREFTSQLALARVARPAHNRPAAELSHIGHADGGAAHGGVGAQLLRRRRKRQLARRQRAQGLQPDRADRHDRGHLRPHSQGPRNCSSRSLAVACREFSVDAEWRQSPRKLRPVPWISL